MKCYKESRAPTYKATDCSALKLKLSIPLLVIALGLNLSLSHGFILNEASNSKMETTTEPQFEFPPLYEDYEAFNKDDPVYQEKPPQKHSIVPSFQVKFNNRFYDYQDVHPSKRPYQIPGGYRYTLTYPSHTLLDAALIEDMCISVWSNGDVDIRTLGDTEENKEPIFNFGSTLSAAAIDKNSRIIAAATAAKYGRVLLKKVEIQARNGSIQLEQTPIDTLLQGNNNPVHKLIFVKKSKQKKYFNRIQLKHIKPTLNNLFVYHGNQHEVVTRIGISTRSEDLYSASPYTRTDDLESVFSCPESTPSVARQPITHDADIFYPFGHDRKTMHQEIVGFKSYCHTRDEVQDTSKMMTGVFPFQFDKNVSSKEILITTVRTL